MSRKEISFNELKDVTGGVAKRTEETKVYICPGCLKKFMNRKEYLEHMDECYKVVPC